MTTETPALPSFWTTVGVLLLTARKRAAGRRKRQQQLLRQRSGGSGTDWSGFGFAAAVFFMLLLNVFAAVAVRMAVESAQRVEAERQGKIVVSSWFYGVAEWACKYPESIDKSLPSSYYSIEAHSIAERYGGNQQAIEQKLREAIYRRDLTAFANKAQASPGIAALSSSTTVAALLGSLVLFLWGAMLVFQGEGLELDLQRRRHPMWEWLFSHPVPPGAVFLAEMLAPLAANPLYWSGPVFAGILYGFVYGEADGVLAALLIGIPVTVAAGCLGKALEIGIMLRFSPRTRGAMIGLMSWMGYASMMLFFVGLFFIPRVVTTFARTLGVLAVLPWPWLQLFLGGQPDGSFSLPSGIITCWLFSGVTIAAAVWFSSWGTQQGLAGNFSVADSRPRRAKSGAAFGKDPLYRKEFLWFVRDRSAIVQAILIPLTVAGFQVFNLRGLLVHAAGAWNYLCGVGILFGTYFLWVLGPKSLSSEGTALWMALTWPRGLESLLKAKAWLWSMISSGLVFVVLCYAAFLYPNSIWKIALVGAGWFFFGRSMAEKTVTLVTVTSSSGEPEKIPWTRRGAAQLGMLTFCIGVLSQQWHIAVMGIVYSYMTAAAMWQNFRARLPYLYDPWSEELPPPPTLMHAMIAISILVEGGAVVTGLVLVFTGRDNIAVAQAISYGICAVIVSFGVSMFLGERGVSSKDIWRWSVPPGKDSRSWWRVFNIQALAPSLLLAVGAGLLLGFLARGYIAVLKHIPTTAELIHKSQEQFARVPNLKISYAIMAIAFAPLAEEYLFRGLLFKSLDREWGGWRAVIGSAAFFAVYHSPLSWLPVAALGAANALIFKKTGRLESAVVLHAVYNAIVIVYT